LNFGQIFGPVAAGILIALWAGLPIGWWEQRQSLLRLLRLMLLMLGAALTFNLGRDISLLVLSPIILHTFLSGSVKSGPGTAFENCRNW